MTYVEVLPPERTGPTHPEWFEARRAGVTASEIAAVLGLSPYESPFSLYWRKRGTMPEQADTAAMGWGRRLESYLADEFAERHPEFHLRQAGLYAHPDRPWQMASPDRLIVERIPSRLAWGGDGWYIGKGAAAVLEAKTAGSWDGWGAEGTDEIPIHYRAQCIWQADVLGVPCVYVPVAVGRTYREYIVTMDDDAQHDVYLMRQRAKLFLMRVEEGIPPDVDDTTATLQTLKALHPSLTDEEARVPKDLAAQWLRTCRQMSALKDRKRDLENRLRLRMGSAKYAVTRDGQKVATRSVYPVKEHVRAASTTDKLVPVGEA